jgi:hypothetical protein
VEEDDMFYFAMNLMSFQSKVFSGIEIAEVYCELQGIVLWKKKEMGINWGLCGGGGVFHFGN